MIRNVLLLLVFLIPVFTALPADADFGEGARAFKEGDFKRAFAIARVEAKKGDALAQTYLGVMYQFGQGTRKNPKEALRWYKKAAHQGQTQAQINVGALYATGEGVQNNYVEALKWFIIAAQSPGTVAPQNRALAERKMTKKQIAHAKRDARAWLKAHGKEMKEE